MTTLVAVDDVSFGYRRNSRILDGVSAGFAAGQTHTITGPSGCGKSTLLYLIGFMLRPDQGAISINGATGGAGSDRERAKLRSEHIGFVFQDALLEPSMTVLENIAEGLPLSQRVSRYRADTDATLTRLGIAELADRKASKLSGGQAQRVALVRAMVKRPTVLLADEPTGNLDDATGAIVLDELFIYGRQPGHTCIIVTHDERIATASDTITRLPAPSKRR